MTMYNEDLELSEAERTALAALPREIAPSDLLEERVVRALRNEGRFEREAKRTRGWMNTSLRIAAGLALFVGGVATGRFMMTSSASEARPATQAVSQSPEPAAVIQDRPSQQVKNSRGAVTEREQWL